MKIEVHLEGQEYEQLEQLSAELGFGCLHDYLFHILWCGLMHELERYGVHDELWAEGIYSREERERKQREKERHEADRNEALSEDDIPF